MSTNTPYSRLVGVWDVYIAPAVEAKPTVSSAPSGDWALLGPTNGEQEISIEGDLEFFRDNDNQGPVKVVRPEEDVIVKFSLVGLTQENFAKILHDVANVTTAAGPPATKTIGLERGFEPSEYSLLLRGELDSPYGAFPGQIYIPRCVEGGTPTMTRAKDGSPEIECEFYSLVYAAGSAGHQLGIWEVQTA